MKEKLKRTYIKDFVIKVFFMKIFFCVALVCLMLLFTSCEKEATEAGALQIDQLELSTEKSTLTPTPTKVLENTKTPTPEPTPEPTSTPTPEPTPEPTNTPTPEPTPEPTSTPTPEPTPEPTNTPTPEPTPEPTNTPKPEPTNKPEPTPEPKTEKGSLPSSLVFSYKGASIKMGADLSNVIAKIGEPSDVFISPSCAFDGDDKICYYSGFYINTFPSGDKDIILSVTITGTVSIPEGVKVGMNRDEMVAKLGDNYEEVMDSYKYVVGNTELTFIFESGKIVEISYYNLAG